MTAVEQKMIGTLLRGVLTISDADIAGQHNVATEYKFQVRSWKEAFEICERLDAALKDDTTIYHYFRNLLARAPRDRSLRKLPCDSPCGKECVAAIDAARALVEAIGCASGESHAHLKRNVIEAAEHAVEIFWRG